MAEDERETPSIAPPSLSFGRRRRREQPEPAPESDVTQPAVEETAVLPTAATPDWDPAWGPAPEIPGERRARAPKPAKAPKAPKAPKPPKAAKEPKAPRPPREPRAPKPPQAPKAARAPRPQRRPIALPAVPPLAAVTITGLLIGLLMVGLTAGSLRACEAARGTATCGGGAGTLLLVAIVILAIWAGGLLLRVLRVADSGGTSFLGVALLCVIALLFLIDDLDQWWMAIVLPVLSAGSFWASHSVSSAVTDEG